MAMALLAGRGYHAAPRKRSYGKAILVVWLWRLQRQEISRHVRKSLIGLRKRLAANRREFRLGGGRAPSSRGLPVGAQRV